MNTASDNTAMTARVDDARAVPATEGGAGIGPSAVAAGLAVVAVGCVSMSRASSQLVGYLDVLYLNPSRKSTDWRMLVS